MSNQDDKEYEEAVRLADMIQRSIADISEAVSYNIDEQDSYSMLSAYSALLTVTSYFEYRLRKNGFLNSAIEGTKAGAEDYVLNMISEELGAVTQKKGNA
jgi:hypothetical protein